MICNRFDEIFFDKWFDIIESNMLFLTVFTNMLIYFVVEI